MVWLIDWLVSWLVLRRTGRLIDWLILDDPIWLHVRVIDWLIDWLSMYNLIFKSNPLKVLIHLFATGRHMGEMSMNNGYKADWRLIPKVEEEAYKTTYRPGLDTLPPKNIVPAAVPFPPLLKMMIRDEAVKQGRPLEKEPMLPLTILRDIWHTPVQEGVEAPLGAASSPSNPGVNTMLPQSMAGKIYLSNINPKKPKHQSSWTTAAFCLKFKLRGCIFPWINRVNRLNTELLGTME